MSSSHHTNTNSDTDVPTGIGLEYPPQVFTNPEFTATVSNSENELDNIESRQNFIGEYCEKCYTQPIQFLTGVGAMPQTGVRI